MTTVVILGLLASLAAREAQDPRPLQPLAAWVSDADYPAGAITREVSGTVAFTLDVDAAGVPTRCTVTGHADPELDQRTCDIFMSRARFEPARDRRGRAVAGSVSSRLRWVLPSPSETMPFVVLRVVTSVTRDAAGAFSCAIRINDADPVGRPEEACGFLTGTGAADALGRLGTPGALVLEYNFVPDGASRGPAAVREGSDLIFEESARLVATADGTIATCQGAGPRVVRTLPGLLRIPRACPAQSVRFDTAEPGAAPREGEVSIKIYLRAG